MNGYQKAIGWDNQLRNKSISNVNIVAEKQVAAYRNWLEVIAGRYAFRGTFVNSGGFNATVRTGKINPYFSGWLKQYSSAESGVQVTEQERAASVNA